MAVSWHSCRSPDPSTLLHSKKDPPSWKDESEMSLSNMEIQPYQISLFHPLFVSRAGLEMPNHESLTHCLLNPNKNQHSGDLYPVCKINYSRDMCLWVLVTSKTVWVLLLWPPCYSPDVLGLCRLLSSTASCLPPHEDAASACAPAKFPDSSGSTIRWIQTKGEFKSKSFFRAIKVHSWELCEPEVGYVSMKLLIMPCFIPLKSLANSLLVLVQLQEKMYLFLPDEALKQTEVHYFL